MKNTEWRSCMRCHHDRTAGKPSHLAARDHTHDVRVAGMTSHLSKNGKRAALNAARSKEFRAPQGRNVHDPMNFYIVIRYVVESALRAGAFSRQREPPGIRPVPDEKNRREETRFWMKSTRVARELRRISRPVDPVAEALTMRCGCRAARAVTDKVVDTIHIGPGFAIAGANAYEHAGREIKRVGGAAAETCAAADADTARCF